MEIKKRTRAQDGAKGLMIIAVIFFHSYLMLFDDHHDALKDFNILMALFPFLLSSFFFYSGYNYKESDKTIKQNIARRAKQLLIPLVFTFVVSTVLISIMELIFNHDNVGQTFRYIGNNVLFGIMSEPLTLLVNYPPQGEMLFSLTLALGLLWFLYALFICSCVFYVLVKFTNKNVCTLISTIVGLLLISFCLGQFVGIYLPYTVQCYPVIIAIMLTAAYLRQFHFLNRPVPNRKDKAFLITNAIIAELIVFGTCVVCYFQFGSVLTGSLPSGLFDPTLKGFDAFIAFAFGILGTYFIHTVCRLIKHVPVLGVSLQWVGNHSALFYLFHPVVLDFVAIVFFQKRVIWGVGQAYFYVFVTIFLLVGIGLLTDLLAKKKKVDRPLVEQIQINEAPEELDKENDK